MKSSKSSRCIWLFNISRYGVSFAFSDVYSLANHYDKIKIKKHIKIINYFYSSSIKDTVVPISLDSNFLILFPNRDN